jgi:hypothetical protein
MVRDDSNTENESITNNSESEEIEEESETGYSTGTGSSTSESVTSTSRRTTTEEGEEEVEESTETSATDDHSLKETIAPIASPIQPIKLTSIAKTEDVRPNIQLQASTTSPPIEDEIDVLPPEKDPLKVEPPPILYDEIRSVDVISGNDDLSNLAVASRNVDTETKNHSKSWLFPFTKNRRSPEQHERLLPSGMPVSSSATHDMLQEYKDPENSTKVEPMTSGPHDSSPSRTVTMSDSGTPDRMGKVTTSSSSAITRRQGKTMTAAPQHEENAEMLNDNGALMVDPRVSTAPSTRCLYLFALAALLTFALSTIGTSYLGADLALRGYKVSSDNADSSIIPSMNDTVIPPAHNDSGVTPPFYTSPCSSGNVPLSFEIVFDSKPAEVGISLKDQSDLTAENSGIWLFPALSFRSFTQFQRKNSFSVCLSNASTFEFEITDTSGNGLVSTFGASTQVFGNWAIRLDSIVVATYFGDCNDPRRNSSTLSDCGDYCRCLFNVSKSRSPVGGCTTVCT